MLPVSIQVSFTCWQCPILPWRSLDISGTNQAKMAVRSLSNALLHGKCPRCREGNIFTYRATKVSRFNVMNSVCPHCGVMFQPEPGFYQGAMYVSYAFAIAIIVAVTALLFLVGDPTDGVYITAIIVAIVVLAPFNYRASRIVYLYMFGGIKFDASR